ncbi:MAG: hypothetical protein DPW18_10555 [Chloroflexi bacterium]|nr:hypothetical protein [Chloroflexota bacterium]MDL1943931.1 hypothetical protein [Chloroflexi bacterium CFX2]
MKKPFPEFLFLLLISAVVYLPHIGNLTYYKDDWYYVYDGMIGGAKVFHEMFRIDRPARGFFFEWYFLLFGVNPLPWHIGAFVWRGLSALGALWIFDILWRGNRKFNFIAALLFAIFPGYFWWISAIEYQPMIASLALQVFSIAFTLKAIQLVAPAAVPGGGDAASSKFKRIAYIIGAVFTGWAYIALVDYAIGMEAFRFIAVYLLVNRDGQLDFWKRLINTVKAWAWTLVIPLGIAVWRIFFFTNERKATDIGGQLGVFFANPLGAGMDWLLQIYKSLLNLSVLAWLDQFPPFVQAMRLRDVAFGVLLAAFVILLVIFAERRIKLSAGEKAGEGWQVQVQKEALTLGGLGMIFGVLPVVMANRSVDIGGFSHYGLPASLAAGVFMAAFLNLFALEKIRAAALYVLIGFAALAHFGIATNAVTEEKALQKFWWQVSWRAPSLRAGTLLVVHYPLPGMGDGGYGLMEAANVIYFPEPTGEIPVHYPLSGLTLNSENLPGILDGAQLIETGYRSHTFTLDYGNILVLSQPTLTSCVHVIDGTQPLISSSDPVNVPLTASASKIENVLTGTESALPPVSIFGEEPEHDWCYYFQKAELAAQTGGWDEVVLLGEQALDLDLSPEDRVEWLPFLKAYAITGNAERLEQTAKRVVGDKSLRVQACGMLRAIQEPLSEDVKQVVDREYCRNSE